MKLLSSVAESDSSMKEPYNQRAKKPMKKLKLHEKEKNELGVVRHSEANQLSQDGRKVTEVRRRQRKCRSAT